MLNNVDFFYFEGKIFHNSGGFYHIDIIKNIFEISFYLPANLDNHCLRFTSEEYFLDHLLSDTWGQFKLLDNYPTRYYIIHRRVNTENVRPCVYNEMVNDAHRYALLEMEKLEWIYA